MWEKFIVKEPTEQEKRIKICRICPEYTVSKALLFDIEKCKKCGCNLQLKTLFPSSKCPLKHW